MDAFKTNPKKIDGETKSLPNDYKEIDDAWKASKLPDMCYANKATIQFRCPSEYPESAGMKCYKKCQPVMVDWR
jgi:hypothetical protein